MNCSDFSASLDELVELRAECLTNEAMEHWQSCSSCEQIWSDHLLLESAIDVWKPVEFSVALLDRVMNELNATGDAVPREVALNVESHFPELTTSLVVARSVATESIASHHSAVARRRHKAMIVATAACLLVLCAVAISRRDFTQNMEARNNSDVIAGHSKHDLQLAAKPLRRSEVSTQIAERGVSESVVAVLADLKAEYQELANETSATARDLVSVMPVPISWGSPMTPSSGTTELDRSNDNDSSSTFELGRSIGDQIGQAVGFLWETVPSRDPAG
jgi:hypothetical protein